LRGLGGSDRVDHIGSCRPRNDVTGDGVAPLEGAGRAGIYGLVIDYEADVH
jgi:hypothetical protein